MSRPILSRAGAKPESLGLTGAAGLQMKPKKLGVPQRARPPPSAFAADDSDDDDQSDRAQVSKELKRASGGSSLQRAAVEAVQAAALEQDASVFDYDGVFDSMQQERSAVRQAAKPKAQEEKKARYIDSIMQAHKKREMENEKAFERKMVKEAEQEADLYGDKERFMTSAYRAKLAARDEYEAELKAQDERDTKNDVTKRDDMSAFYSNLLHDRVAPGGATASGSEGAKPSGGSSGSGAPDARPSAENDAAASSNEPAGLQVPTEPTAPARKGLVNEDLATAISAATAALKKDGVRQVQPAAPPAPAANHERRNDSDAVQQARERYLERKRQRRDQDTL